MGECLRIILSVLPVKIQHPLIVLNRVLISCSALSDKAVSFPSLKVIGEEGNIGRKAHAQRSGKSPELLFILQKGREISCLPLGGRVQGDAHQLMIHKRIVEAVCHGGREVLAVCLVQRKDRDDLIEQESVHKAVDRLILHALADNVLPCKVGTENKAGVCAV